MENTQEEIELDKILLDKIERRFKNDRTEKDCNSDMPRVW